MITTDKNDTGLQKTKDNGQNEMYLVLSKEERDKGYKRPFRDCYIHKGRHYEHKPEMLDRDYVNNNGKIYAALVTVLLDECGDPKGRAYLTQKEVDDYNNKGGYVGGCESSTTMHYDIAETYARDPHFYGATFCVTCGTHLPVGEFVWEGTDEKVGS